MIESETLRVIGRYKNRIITYNPSNGIKSTILLPKKHYAVIGDLVKLDKNKIDILPRKTLFRRCYFDKTKAIAANIDSCLIIVAPDKLFNTHFIDRAIVAALDTEVKPLLMFNKTDLGYSDSEMELIEYYQRKLLIPCFQFSCINDSSQSLIDFLCNNSCAHTLFTGLSGVGKSTTLNLFITDEDQQARTSSVSEKSGVGKNTTTNGSAYLVDFKHSIWIYDTPGLQSFGISHIELSRLPFFFSDFFNFGTQCKYRDCNHFNRKVVESNSEKQISATSAEIFHDDCAVCDNVAAGTIPISRYRSWISIWMEIYAAEHSY